MWSEISCMTQSSASFSDPPDVPQNLECVQKMKSGNVSCIWTTGRGTIIDTTCQLRLVKSALQGGSCSLQIIWCNTKQRHIRKSLLITSLCFFRVRDGLHHGYESIMNSTGFCYSTFPIKNSIKSQLIVSLNVSNSLGSQASGPHTIILSNIGK